MKMNWFLLAIISMLLFTFMNLLFKKVLDLKVNSEVLIAYIFGLGFIMSLFYLIGKGESLQVTRLPFLLLVLAAAFSITANFFLTQSIKTAPNPGYSLAVNSIQILLVAIASIFLFNSEFTLIKGIGTVLAVIGIILLGI